MIGTHKDLEPELLMCHSGGKPVTSRHAVICIPHPFTGASEVQVDLLAKNDLSLTLKGTKCRKTHLLTARILGFFF